MDSELIVNLAARLDAVIKAAGVAITGVSIGDPANKATWKVQPATLQGAAQATIDAFNVTDPAHDSAELNLAVTGHLDAERIYSAIIWAVIDTYSAPATKAKYDTARAKVVSAFKLTPWK